MKIIIEGSPIPKQRHRCGCRGKKPISYDPQKPLMASIKKKMLAEIKRACNSEKREVATEASELTKVNSFELSLVFLFPTAKSLTLSKKNAKLWGLQVHNGPPDFDNLEKLYSDCLTDLVWSNDCQIVFNESKKFYSEKPRTEITIMAKKGLELTDSAEGVLKIFSPSELRKFLKDATEFWTVPLEKFDELLPEGKEEFKETNLTCLAYMLIEFAKNHADKLRKIKNFPLDREIKNPI